MSNDDIYFSKVVECYMKCTKSFEIGPYVEKVCKRLRKYEKVCLKLRKYVKSYQIMLKANKV